MISQKLILQPAHNGRLLAFCAQRYRDLAKIGRQLHVESMPIKTISSTLKP